MPAKTGDLYFTVEFYYWEMVPSRCSLLMGQPLLDLYIYKNGELLTNVFYYDYYHEPQLYSESDYEVSQTRLEMCSHLELITGISSVQFQEISQSKSIHHKT